jgi:poly(beta-D-mannuronate) lyase
VFSANAGGATTSGSGYPRSELRELTNGGTALANWSTTGGTHTMTITQAVTRLTPVKPHLVVGQIHDANDDVMVIRLEGRHLFVDHNGVAGATLSNDYTLGTRFTVRIVAGGGHVRTYYNGAATPADDYAVSASGCYFKAGAYVQTNVSKGEAADASAANTVYALAVTHTA